MTREEIKELQRFAKAPKLTRYNVTLVGGRGITLATHLDIKPGQWVKPFRDEPWVKICSIEPSESQKICIGDGLVDKDPREDNKTCTR
jgi:hypothetical protein